MSARLIYYNPAVVNRPENHVLPGLFRFSQLFKVINPTVSVVDRTGTLGLPIRAHSLFPIPKLKGMNRTFEDLCNERAVDLLRRADRLGAKLYVFWSGGIDSTLALISFLKNTTEAERKNIVILLSEDSINEYPKFYKEHIRGRLQSDSAMMFPYLLGGKHIVVNGEHNDQLFGSDMVGHLINKFGPSVIHQPYNRDTFFAFFNEGINDSAGTNFYLDVLERLRAAAPVDIATNFLCLWWFNFCLKWQTVFMRTLSYAAARNTGRMDLDYIDTNYSPFYCTEDFQLWSMNNLESRIRDSWKTYKWVCKDIIYEYTKDADYRDNKAKRGSLYFLITQQKSYNFIDETMKFFHEASPEQFYEPVNDFAEAADREPADLSPGRQSHPSRQAETMST
jgi:hypothetical protein